MSRPSSRPARRSRSLTTALAALVTSVMLACGPAPTEAPPAPAPRAVAAPKAVHDDVPNDSTTGRSGGYTNPNI